MTTWMLIFCGFAAATVVGIFIIIMTCCCNRTKGADAEDEDDDEYGLECTWTLFCVIILLIVWAALATLAALRIFNYF